VPKRKYEPLFSGYINIVIDEWRIHSVQLQLTKQSQMQLVDTLELDQLYVPYNNEVWVIKSQVIYPAIKIFGFDAYGSFVNVYSKFSVDPKFEKNFFNSTVMKYDDSSNKKEGKLLGSGETYSVTTGRNSRLQKERQFGAGKKRSEVSRLAGSEA
jgi:hypothetical protein